MERVGINEVSFTLPSLPLSHNSLYTIIFSQRRVELCTAARQWKSQSKAYVPRFRLLLPLSSIEIVCTFHYPFNYSNGRPRKFDASNLLKLTIDTIAEKIGYDDNLFRFGQWSAIDSHDEKVEVKLREIPSLQPQREGV